MALSCQVTDGFHALVTFSLPVDAANTSVAGLELKVGGAWQAPTFGSVVDGNLVLDLTGYSATPSQWRIVAGGDPITFVPVAPLLLTTPTNTIVTPAAIASVTKIQPTAYMVQYDRFIQFLDLPTLAATIAIDGQNVTSPAMNDSSSIFVEGPENAVAWTCQHEFDSTIPGTAAGAGIIS